VTADGAGTTGGSTRSLPPGVASRLPVRDAHLGRGSGRCGGVLQTVAVSLLLALAYTYRIATEERMLVAALGADYEAYRQRSWRLIPFVY